MMPRPGLQTHAFLCNRLAFHLQPHAFCLQTLAHDYISPVHHLQALAHSRRSYRHPLCKFRHRFCGHRQNFASIDIRFEEILKNVSLNTKIVSSFRTILRKSAKMIPQSAKLFHHLKEFCGNPQIG